MKVLAFLYVVCLQLFILVSLPVYIYRQVIILLAKYLRPDLGDILNGLSCWLSNDYFSKTPPRSNIVVTLKTNGHLSTQEFKNVVLQKWISDRINYKQFQQYPVHWMGFTFWKNVASFNINDYVRTLGKCETTFGEEDLSISTEKILNSSHKREHSPWQFYIIENFKSRSSPGVAQSVIIFKIHHCLADGFSILSALVEGLFDTSLKDNSSLPKARFPTRTLLGNVIYWVKFPFNFLLEQIEIFSHIFETNPLMVPDKRKEWHQVYYKCDLVPIKEIKNLKNHFGVSFASVLLSSFSSAIGKHLGDKGTDRIQCLSTLPRPNRRLNEGLTNKATGAVFNLSTIKDKDPVERLRDVNATLEETRMATIPVASHLFTTLIGCQLHFVQRLFKNNYISIGLSNFPGVAQKMELNGKEIAECSFIVGGLVGNSGVVIAALSHRDHFQIELCAEKGLMSRDQLGILGENILKEINLLKQIENKTTN